jgi:hypothetical protein
LKVIANNVYIREKCNPDECARLIEFCNKQPELRRLDTLVSNLKRPFLDASLDDAELDKLILTAAQRGPEKRMRRSTDALSSEELRDESCNNLDPMVLSS